MKVNVAQFYWWIKLNVVFLGISRPFLLTYTRSHTQKPEGTITYNTQKPEGTNTYTKKSLKAIEKAHLVSAINLNHYLQWNLC